MTARTAATMALALTLGAGAFTAASAQTGRPPAGDERYQMERVGEDILRLDRETGEVQLCAQSQPRFTCRIVVERSVRETPRGLPASGEVLAENEALKAEVAALTRRLEMIKALLDDVEPAPVASLGSLSRDARREIDDAIEVTDYAVRRFRTLVESLTADDSPPQ